MKLWVVSCKRHRSSDRLRIGCQIGQTSHESVHLPWNAGAAAFAAMRAYEKHQSANGQPPSHQFAKELIAGIAGAEVNFPVCHTAAPKRSFLFIQISPVQVDKLVETKGLDYVDREKAKRHAKQQAEQIYDQQYGNRDVGGDGGNWGNVGQQYGVGGGGGMPS